MSIEARWSPTSNTALSRRSSETGSFHPQTRPHGGRLLEQRASSSTMPGEPASSPASHRSSALTGFRAAFQPASARSGCAARGRSGAFSPPARNAAEIATAALAPIEPSARRSRTASPPHDGSHRAPRSRGAVDDAANRRLGSERARMIPPGSTDSSVVPRAVPRDCGSTSRDAVLGADHCSVGRIAAPAGRHLGQAVGLEAQKDDVGVADCPRGSSVASGGR